MPRLIVLAADQGALIVHGGCFGSRKEALPVALSSRRRSPASATRRTPGPLGGIQVL